MCTMISLRERLQCLLLLLSSITVGLVVAMLAHASGGTEAVMVMLVAALPFFLATLTGVAKTTTAGGLSMIGTIGFLVQETSQGWHWLLAASLYTLACLSTAMLLGTLLGTLGHLLGDGAQGAGVYAGFPHAGAWLIGLLALAYALSDVRLLRLPHPTLRQAVSITWWQRWRPYGAARALMIFPASWELYCHHRALTQWFSSLLFNLWRTQRILAVALIMFATLALLSYVR
jgi:hypothetical protein